MHTNPYEYTCIYSNVLYTPNIVLTFFTQWHLYIAYMHTYVHTSFLAPAGSPVSMMATSPLPPAAVSSMSLSLPSAAAAAASTSAARRYGDGGSARKKKKRNSNKGRKKSKKNKNKNKNRQSSSSDDSSFGTVTPMPHFQLWLDSFKRNKTLYRSIQYNTMSELRSCHISDDLWMQSTTFITNKHTLIITKNWVTFYIGSFFNHNKLNFWKSTARTALEGRLETI